MRAAADDADPVVSRAQAAPDALLRNLVHDCAAAALTLPVVPGMDAARRGRPGAPLHVNHSARTTSPRGRDEEADSSMGRRRPDAVSDAAVSQAAATVALG